MQSKMAAVVNDCVSLCVSPFLGLADEIIDLILSYSFLDHRDICSFAQTCVRFKEIANYTELWKKKALLRWKHWKNTRENHWKDIYRNRYLTEIEIVTVLDKLCIKYGSKADVSSAEYKSLVYLVDGHPYADWLQCILEEIIGGEPRKSNLTHQYYAIRLYGYFLKLSLKKDWANLMKKPPEDQHLEDGALIIAKWIDHNIILNGSAEKVKAKLNSMAGRVQTVLQENSTSEDGCSSSSDHDHAIKILEGVKQVMYEEEQFSGNSDDYYNIDNSLINQVLEKKQGIPISLAVVFVEIARRLGVQIETVNSPNHFLLRYASSQQLRDAPSPIYIDAFDKGRFFSQTQCYEQFIEGIPGFVSPETAFRTASPKDVFIRMVSNLVNIYHSYYRNDNGLHALRNGIELLILVNPTDRKYKTLLAHVNLHLGINLDESIEMLQEMLAVQQYNVLTNLIERAQEKQYKDQQEEKKPIKQKFKSAAQNNKVKYRVGMVMRHRRYHYGCVIYGWDNFCDMNESWILQMGVDRLPLGRSQPFYNVLGDDGSSRYASQENLMEEPDQPFNPHPEIGKYFKYWTGTQYIPNEYLSQRYPEDYLQETNN